MLSERSRAAGNPLAFHPPAPLAAFAGDQDPEREQGADHEQAVSEEVDQGDGHDSCDGRDRQRRPGGYCSAGIGGCRGARVVRDARACRFPEGVEVAEGDLSVPGTLEGALTGIEAVFLVWPFLTSDGAPAILATIARAARRLVYLSSSGVNEDAGRRLIRSSAPCRHGEPDRSVGPGVDHPAGEHDRLQHTRVGWAAPPRGCCPWSRHRPHGGDRRSATSRPSRPGC